MRTLATIPNEAAPASLPYFDNATAGIPDGHGMTLRACDRSCLAARSNEIVSAQISPKTSLHSEGPIRVMRDGCRGQNYVAGTAWTIVANSMVLKEMRRVVPRDLA